MDEAVPIFVQVGTARVEESESMLGNWRSTVRNTAKVGGDVGKTTSFLEHWIKLKGSFWSWPISECVFVFFGMWDDQEPLSYPVSHVFIYIIFYFGMIQSVFFLPWIAIHSPRNHTGSGDRAPLESHHRLASQWLSWHLGGSPRVTWKGLRGPNHCEIQKKM